MLRTALRTTRLLRAFRPVSVFSNASALQCQQFNRQIVVPTRTLNLSAPLRQSQEDNVNSDFDNLPDYVKNFVFLSDMPFVFLPHFWKSIRNRIFEFMIRGYMDSDFSIESFSEGATQAVLKISNALADGNVDSLIDMDVISYDCITEVKENLAKMTDEQREFLRVNQKDILRSFIYEIGMIMDDETGTNNSLLCFFSPVSLFCFHLFR